MKVMFASFLLVAALLAAAGARAQPRELPYGAFAFDLALTLPGTPDEIFGAITGDVSGWWDHSFSGNPAKFYLEPIVGGGFYEYFDDKGNGVRHAVVTYVDRPKLLRMEGPLGLAGNAFLGVYTYNFAPAGDDSTTLTLQVRASGHVEKEWAGLVEKVWRHFLLERFKPYVELGVHRGRR